MPLLSALERIAKEANLEGIRLGEPARDPDAAQVEFRESIARQLNDEMRFNRGIIVVIVALYVMLFVVACLLLVHYRNNPALVITLCGGSVLSLLIIMQRLLSVWREKVAMDLLRAMSSGLVPQDLALIVKLFLNAERQHKRKGVQSAR